MAFFAVTLVHGQNWDASRQIRQQQAWDQHAAFMDGLVDDGFLVLGGPLGDGERTLHAVEAADEREIWARLAEDPWGCSRSARSSHGPSGSTAGRGTGPADRALARGYLPEFWLGSRDAAAQAA